MAMYYHRVWADIDLDALSHNLEKMRSLLPAGASIMPVVKADAYGHGAVHVARHLERRGIWGFGVGDSNEALQLRAAGITRPILILGAIVEDEIGKVVKNEVSVCVHSEQRIDILNREAIRQGKRCRTHLMVDTGMGRLGVFPEHAVRMARRIIATEGLILDGVLTHYSCASHPDDDFTGLQQDRFVTVKAAMEEAGILPDFYHASNSGAVLSRLSEPFNLVRCGIALYGVSSAPDLSPQAGLKPVLSLKAQIIYMKDVPAGTPIGYERLYITPKATRIATLPIGYNDGFPYRLSNRGRVLVHGKSAPVVGAVSMDYSMIDVGDIEGTAVGDRVTLIGEEDGHRVTVEELAGQAGTIPYEITCGIGMRVRRIAVDTEGKASFRAERSALREQSMERR